MIAFRRGNPHAWAVGGSAML